MLPNKQYFQISALVSASVLHEIMRYLEQKKAYNVEVTTFKADYEKEEPKELKKKNSPKRDMTKIKEEIIAFLTKHGPSRAVEILDTFNLGKDFSLFGRMVKSKQIKKVKKGVYKV